MAKTLVDVTTATMRIDFQIDGHWPGEIRPGEWADLVLHGKAASPAGPIEMVELRVGDHMVAVPFARLPCIETLDADWAEIPPERRLFRGFTVAWSGRFAESGKVNVSVRFTVAARQGLLTGEWQRIGVLEIAAPRVRKLSGEAPLVAIAMATYNPDAELFAAQIDSIRRQAMTDWRLVISDESDNPMSAALIAAVVASEPRIRVLRGPRVGFLGNFERALREIDRRAPYFAFADQDDVWYPEKLETLVAEIERRSCDLVHADMRIVDRNGIEVAPGFWNWWRRHGETADEILAVNTVTGAAMLARMDLLPLALPFPYYAEVFHDMWIALLAARRNGIGYVDKVLQGYVQHGANIVGSDGGASDRQAATKLRSQASMLESLARAIDISSADDASPGAEQAAEMQPAALAVLATATPALILRAFLDQCARNRIAGSGSPLDMVDLTYAPQGLHPDPDDRRYLAIPSWLEAASHALGAIKRHPYVRLQIAKRISSTER